MSAISNYSPYAPNNEGLTEVLIDLKDTIATVVPYSTIGFRAITIEAVNQGQALYSRASDARVGLAIANSTLEKATVVGFARTTVASGEEVDILVTGVLSTSGLNSGDIYYLSDSGNGSITTVAPSTTGHFVTRVGEAATGSSLIIHLNPSILLS